MFRWFAIIAILFTVACGRPEFGTTNEGGKVLDTNVDRADADPAGGPENNGVGIDDDALNGDFGGEEPSAPPEPVDNSSGQGLVTGEFAFDAYREVAAEGRNSIIAPHGLARSLVIAHAAAGPNVAGVVASVVGDYLGSDIYGGFNSTDLDLEAREDNESFSMLAAVWAESDVAVEEDFLNVLAMYLGQQLRLLDIQASPEDARNQINNWYSAQTDGRISEVLGPRTLDSSSRFVITDATWFDANWGFGGFDESMTTYETFEGSETNVQLPMMAVDTSVLYFGGDDGLQAVVLPFDNGFSLLAVLPANLEAFEGALNNGFLDRIVDEAEPAPVMLRMPRIEVSDRVSLSSVADAIGVGAAFATDAEYTAFADGTQLDDAHQRTRVSFDEQGVSGGSTGGGNNDMDPVTNPSPPGESVELMFNRPFFFAVRDSQSGRYLFLGRVAQP